MVILLQEKNFGPNVIYYVSTFAKSYQEIAGAARSYQDIVGATRSYQGAFWEPKCWFFIDFISKTWFWPEKCQYFIGFISFCENKVAVAAAPLVDLPPHCSHRWFFSANVDISKVLATFLVSSEARGRKTSSPALLTQACLSPFKLPLKLPFH